MQKIRFQGHRALYAVALAAVVILLVGAAMGQDASAAPSAATNPTAADQNYSTAPALQQRGPRYRIERGDVLALDFRFTPEYNAAVTVQPDGYISLRGIGDLHAEGMTLPELNKALEAEYSKTLHDPVITVTPQDFVKPYFTVGGEVSKPGKYDLHGDTTVVQAISIAGSFTSNAKHSQVLLFRQVGNDTVSAKIVDVKHMLKSHELAEDMHLQPGDMLYVPKNAMSKIMPYLSLGLFRATFPIQ